LEWLVRADLVLLGTLLGNTFFILFDRLYNYHISSHGTSFATILPQSSDLKAIDFAHQSPRQSAKRRSQELTVGFSSLASTATCAPLLGFLGTVFGIWDSFPGVGMEKTAAMMVTMSALAAALVTTALGILVAVVAAWCRSYLRGRVRLLENGVTSVAKDGAQSHAAWGYCEIAYDRQRVVSLGIWSYLLYIALAFASY